MSEEAKEAGTLETKPEGGTSTEAGTQVAGPEGGTNKAEDIESLKQQLAKVEEDKQQLLGQKTKSEEVKKRLEETEAELARLRNQSPPTSSEQEQQAILQKRYYQLQRLAESGDPVAQQQLDDMSQGQEWRWRMTMDSQINAIPNPEHRDELRKKFYDGEFKNHRDVNSYYSAFIGNKEKARADALEKQLEQLRKANGVAGETTKMGTAVQSVGVGEDTKRKLTLREYQGLSGDAAKKAREEKDSGTLEIDYGL